MQRLVKTCVSFCRYLTIKKVHRPSRLRKRPKPHQRKMVRIWIAFLHQTRKIRTVSRKRRVRIFCFRRRAPPHNKSIRSAWPGCFSSGAVRCGCLFFRPCSTHHCAALAVSGSATSLKAGASVGSGRPAVFHSSRAVWARFSGMATPSGSRAFSCCSET